MSWLESQASRWDWLRRRSGFREGVTPRSRNWQPPAPSCGFALPRHPATSAGRRCARLLRSLRVARHRFDVLLLVHFLTPLRRKGELALPVAIMAGDGDKIVIHRIAERLQSEVPGSTLRIVEGAGHMVYHVASDEVVDAILAVTSASEPQELLGARSMR